MKGEMKCNSITIMLFFYIISLECVEKVFSEKVFRDNTDLLRKKRNSRLYEYYTLVL